MKYNKRGAERKRSRQKQTRIRADARIRIFGNQRTRFPSAAHTCARKIHLARVAVSGSDPFRGMKFPRRCAAANAVKIGRTHREPLACAWPSPRPVRRTQWRQASSRICVCCGIKLRAEKMWHVFLLIFGMLGFWSISLSRFRFT